MAALNPANGLPVLPTPLVSMVTSFLTYHRLKERGGKPVGGQILDDIYAFAQEHLLVVAYTLPLTRFETSLFSPSC
jgi:hypothetical protein